MKRIIRKDLQKKRKLNLTLDWMTKHGAVNPNQQTINRQIKAHKNISFNQRHGAKKYSTNIEIMNKLNKINGTLPDRNLSSVYSQKIRDLEYDKLLSRLLERNRLKRNNNKFTLNLEDKDRADEVFNEVVVAGIKSKIISNIQGKLLKNLINFRIITWGSITKSRSFNKKYNKRIIK